MKDYRLDYPFFKNNPNTIFFDNAATALKPQCVIDAVTYYYSHLSCNSFLISSSLIFSII